MKKIIRCLLVGFGMSLSAGCGLIPREEILPEAPAVEAYEADSYVQVPVTRGDIIARVRVECSYRAARIQEIKYPAEGAAISKMYVEAGDTVKAGELLAQLEQGTLPAQIQELTEQISVLELSLAQEEESRGLAVENQRILQEAYRTAGSYDGIPEDADTSGYDREMRRIEDEIYIKQKYLQKLLDQSELCQVKAGMDGMIRYVFHDMGGNRISTDTVFIRIIDNESCYFEAAADKTWFPENEDVIITVNGTEHEAYAVSAGALGTDTADIESADSDKVYFRLKLPDPSLASGVRGTIEYITERKQDVLLVPQKGIIETEDGYYVYMEEEGGLRAMKQVGVGLIADGNAEITDGLTEGESIIIE